MFFTKCRFSLLLLTLAIPFSATSQDSLNGINELRNAHGLEKLDGVLSEQAALVQTADQLAGKNLGELWKSWKMAEQEDPPLPQTLTLQSLNAAIPTNPIYQHLQAEYQKQVQSVESRQSQFNPLPLPQGEEIVKAGDPYEGAKQLSQMLIAQGYLQASANAQPGTIYTPGLAEGVKAYQEEQGLAADGIIGPNTLSALNQSPEEQLEKLRINLNRARLLPEDFGSRYVIANLPSGMVHGYDGTGLTPSISMRIVYGAATNDRQTEIFHDVMEHVVFRPYWRIPIDIAKNEIVPKTQSNPGYLASKNYQIVSDYDGDPVAPSYQTLQAAADGSLKMRQAPGGSNALGLVKFLFPNDHAIYLHDTPEDQLFNESARDFSHGCVRLEKPAEMAAWVLGAQGWDSARVNNAMQSGDDNSWVNIENPINVYLVYFTAFPSPDGTIRFYKDVYDRDSRASEIISSYTPNL